MRNHPAMEEYQQLEFFPSDNNRPDHFSPSSVMWNLWHGCTKVSAGCKNCYVYRRDLMNGKDPTSVHKTQAFHLPVQRYRSGARKGDYKYLSGTRFYTCFSSDFFHPDADSWRDEAWDMMKTRSDCFFTMITKRPERILQSLPSDWGNGYDNIEISCTCENQAMADIRLPVFLELPLKHCSIIHEPMLSQIDLRKYLIQYGNKIESISVGGESGPEARVCDYSWVLDARTQCLEYGIPFHYHQTGAKLLKDGRLYNIPRREQHRQAKKAGIDIRL